MSPPSRPQDAGNGFHLAQRGGFRFRQVLALKGTAACGAWVLRAGMGAHFGLTCWRVSLTTCPYRSLSVTSSHQGELIQNLKLPHPAQLGHEGQGVCAELMQRAAVHVRIGRVVRNPERPLRRPFAVRQQTRVSITAVITTEPCHVLKLTQIGNSVGAVFPRELLNQLQLEKGDALYVTESPDGLRITKHNPEFAEQMQAARDIMKRRRDVLHELAK